MELDPGQEVCTIGFPGELYSVQEDYSPVIPTFKDGIISALRPYDSSTSANPVQIRLVGKMVQHSLDLTRGTSGSPIFNRRGEVVAINNSGFESTDEGFGIRADELQDLYRAM